MTGAATGESRYIEFYMGELCTVLPLEWVERVVRIVEITPLAGAPDIVRGAVNVAGQIAHWSFAGQGFSPLRVLRDARGASAAPHRSAFCQ